MNVAPLPLAAAVFLLWTPTMPFVGQPMRDRLKNSIRNRSATIGRMALTPINWIDFIRALAGAWVLRELVVTTEAGVPLILVQGGILGVGALSQTVWRDDGLIVIGPVFYIAGAAMFLVSWQVALFAVLLGITLAQMLGRLSWMFAFAPFFFLVFAVVFGGFGLWLPVGAGLFVVPPLVAVGARAPLAMMHARSVLDRMRVPHAKI